jgi:hypothetical protein
LAGVSAPLPQNLDGGDLSALFHGAQEPVQRAQDALVFHFPHYQGDTPHSAIRLGAYKLLHFYETGENRVYDLEHDLGEQNDLAKSRPEIAAELHRRLAAYLQEAGAAMPTPNPDYDPARKGGKGKGMKKRPS